MKSNYLIFLLLIVFTGGSCEKEPMPVDEAFVRCMQERLDMLICTRDTVSDAWMKATVNGVEWCMYHRVDLTHYSFGIETSFTTDPKGVLIPGSTFGKSCVLKFLTNRNSPIDATPGFSIGTRTIPADSFELKRYLDEELAVGPVKITENNTDPRFRHIQIYFNYSCVNWPLTELPSKVAMKTGLLILQDHPDSKAEIVKHEVVPFPGGERHIIGFSFEGVLIQQDIDHFPGVYYGRVEDGYMEGFADVLL